MKKILFFAVILLASTAAFSQVEKGDFNISGSLSFNKYKDVDGMGQFDAKGGYYVTQNIEVGATALILASGGDTGIGIGPYGAYNFLTQDAKLLPYVGANLFLFSIGDISLNSAGINGGAKYFITEAINIDAGLSIQQSFGDVEGSLFTARVGIGFILGKVK
jgi:hypothetical protein